MKLKLTDSPGIAGGFYWIHQKKNFESLRSSSLDSGDHLLSQAASHQVPSTAQVLTVVFGMGTGVSPKRIITGNFQFMRSADSTAFL